MSWAEEPSLRVEIERSLRGQGESWDDIEDSILPEGVLDKPFALDETAPFVIWTKRRVYFPISYDNGYRFYVSSVPRHPDGNPAVYIEAWS